MKKTFFVVSGDYEEFLEYVRKKTIDSYDFRYVYDRKTLVGFNDPHGCFCGSWRKRKDIQEILMELIVRTTSGNNRILKDLLEEISESS
jgi:hypothetical protein